MARRCLEDFEVNQPAVPAHHPVVVLSLKAILRDSRQATVEHPGLSVARRDAEIVDDAGGWADTLTEDLDLSYRAQLAGWRFVYRDEVAVPCKLPVEIAAYRVQQARWAQGSVETAVRMLPRVVRCAAGARREDRSVPAPAVTPGLRPRRRRGRRGGIT